MYLLTYVDKGNCFVVDLETNKAFGANMVRLRQLYMERGGLNFKFNNNGKLLVRAGIELGLTVQDKNVLFIAGKFGDGPTIDAEYTVVFRQGLNHAIKIVSGYDIVKYYYDDIHCGFHVSRGNSRRMYSITIENSNFVEWKCEKSKKKDTDPDLFKILPGLQNKSTAIEEDTSYTGKDWVQRYSNEKLGGR